MEDLIQKIWDGAPSVQPLVAAGAEVSARRDVTLTDEEASAIVAALHKACHANATVSDSMSAVRSVMGSEIAAEFLTRSFDWLKAVVSRVVVPKWIDQSVADGTATPPAPSSGSGAGASTAADDDAAVVVLTAVEEQLRRIVDCILDDRDPQPLLPLEAVLTVPYKPLMIHTPFREFVTLTTYPPYPSVYYRMWKEIVALTRPSTDPTAEEPPATISFEDFATWFTFLYRLQVENATPARARVAARQLWEDTQRTTVAKQMRFEDFMCAAQNFAQRYAKREGEAIVKHYEDIVAFAVAQRAEGSSQSVFSLDISSCPAIPTKTVLTSAEQVHRLDDLDADRCEEAHFRVPTANRVLVNGPFGVDNAEMAKEVAKQLSAVYVDVFRAALDAVDAPSSSASASTLAGTLLECIATGQQVSLETRAALVAGVLARPSTHHLGYVLDDVPAQNTEDLSRYYGLCGIASGSAVVQNIVLLRSTGRVALELAKVNSEARARKREEDLHRRAEEASALERKAAAKSQREAKRAAKAARAERKAKIEAGEIAATEEDSAPEPEDEDLEEPPELDEEGNPMEPEAVQLRDAARAKQRARRILEEDLWYALRVGSDSAAASPSLAAVDVLKLPSLADVVEFCQNRAKVVEIGVHTSASQAATFICQQLGLQASCAPQDIPPPEDTAENPDGSAENDIAIADAKLRAATEGANACTFSKWKRFCSVTYRDEGVLVEGSMAFSVTYRGRIYCFCSKEKLARFRDNPHEFLRTNVTGLGPVMVLKRTLDVFRSGSGGPSASEFETEFAAALGLTPQSFLEFASLWNAQRELASGRKSAMNARSAADAKQRVGREERLKKRLEAEAKKKKAQAKDDKAKKGGKKKDDAGDDAGAAAAGEETAAAEPPVVVETTADRTGKAIAAEVAKRDSFCPLLVSLLQTVDEANFNTLFDERVLPPTVVSLEYNVPQPEGEGENAEEEAVEDEPAAAEDEPGADEVDDNGNPKPKPPKAVKVFDPTDEKQYKRLMTKFVNKLNASTESSSTDPEPAAEGQPATKPYQAFQVITLNCYGKSLQEIRDALLLLIHPLAVGALPPQDGEDFATDPEPEEGETRNPLLIPGPKAIHQFGATLKFCPVSYRDKGVLAYGDPANWMSFKGKKYTFVSPEAMAVFKENPAKYTTDVVVRVPPRLWILGVPCSGKKTVASMLSETARIPQFYFDDDFFAELLAAVTSESGGVVRGLTIPSAPNNAYAIRAAKIAAELKAFDESQERAAALKEQLLKEQADREARRDAGEEVEDLDEEEEAEIAKGIEFEPEEAEAKEERLSKARRQMAAALTRIPPFENDGYILVGRPASEPEMQSLLDEGAFPDAVISIKISAETFVARQIEAEFERRQAARAAKQREVEDKRKAIQLRAREVELRKWRRRNIGADDAADEDAAEEPPEDIEPVTMEGVRSDLEAAYETENSTVSGVVGALPDRRVVVVELSGDGGKSELLRTCNRQLERVLECRRSMFHAVQVVAFDDAVSYALQGKKMLSSFCFHDPVALADERQGAPFRLRMKTDGKVVVGEAEVVPEVPVETVKEKKFHKVTKVNEETGEEYEVEEEVEDAEPEPAAAAEEDEPAEPLEPEPEVSPEEMEEMAKEHQEKRLSLAKKKQRRAAILGHRLYFFNNDDNLLRFIAHPLRYWDQPPPLPEIPGAVVTVFEDIAPPSGETKRRSMGEHTALNTGAVFVNIPKLLQWALLTPSLSYLHVAARDALVRSTEPPTEIVASLLLNRLRCADVCSRGAVLENLPRDAFQLQQLYDSGLRLSKCFTFPNSRLTGVAESIQKTAAIVHPVTAEAYSMASLHDVVTAILRSIHQQRQYQLRKSLGFPASIAHTTTLESVIREHRSQYLWYCPYMWCRHEQLVEIPSDRSLVVAYLGKFFCISKEEFFQEFMIHPEVVSGESMNFGSGANGDVKKLQLPEVLPTHLSAEEVAKLRPALELEGCCPVTLYQTRFRVGLRGVTEPIAVTGDAVHFVAEYNKKYYAMKSAENMTAFLRQPWVFARFAVLPSADKLPFDEAELAKTANDELYIARMLKEAAAHAMLAVCRVRPKFPGLTAEESALKFVALYLKAHNDKNSEIARRQYEYNFEQFAKEASLYKTITTEPPEDADGLQRFEDLCHAWDRVQDDPEGYRSYVLLKRDHEASS